MSTDPNKQISIGTGSVSLMQIAGVDMSAVEEVRYFPFAKGSYMWRVKSAELGTKEIKEIEKPLAVFELECVNCFAVFETDKAPEDFVGKVMKHDVTMFEDLEEFIGRTKAFIVDIGGVASGPFQNALAGTVGVLFNSNVSHRLDKNDKSKSYPFIALDTIAPVAATEAAPVAAAAPAEDAAGAVPQAAPGVAPIG